MVPKVMVPFKYSNIQVDAISESGRSFAIKLNQNFDCVWNAIQSLPDQVQEVVTEASIQALNDALANETAQRLIDRTSAIAARNQAIADAVASEATARQTADDAAVASMTAAMQSSMASEVTARNAAVAASSASQTSAMNSAMATEASARQSADTAEANARQAADAAEVTARNGAITTAINGEVTARNTAINDAMAAEVTARNAAIAASGNTSSTALANEITARTNADAAEASARQAADTAETNARIAGDNANTTAINNEVAARTAAGAAEVTARTNADTAEAAIRQSADDALTLSIAAVALSLSRRFIGTTTGVIAVRLTENGQTAAATNTHPLPNNTTRAYRMLVSARQTGGTAGTIGDTAMWTIETMAMRGPAAANIAISNGASLTVNLGVLGLALGVTSVAPMFSTGSGSAWRLALAADTALGALAVTATGEANKTIAFAARMDYCDVS